MDMVGLGIVTTFFSMLFVSAFAVQAQSPPSEQAYTECPESGHEATLTLSWDVTKQNLAIDICDQKSLAGDRCHETCLRSLQGSYPRIAASMVIG